MGLFGDKDAIVGAALGASGVFDENTKPDPYQAIGMAFGASIASGKNWTFEDTMKMGAILGSRGAFDKK